MIQRLFADIESTKTAVTANVASGQKSFIRALWSIPSVRELSRLSKEYSDAVKVLKRINDLAILNIDVRYANPSDSALSAYLLILQSTRSELAYIGAATVAKFGKNCWWSIRITEDIISDQDKASTSKDAEDRRETDKAEEVLNPYTDSDQINLIFSLYGSPVVESDWDYRVSLSAATKDQPVSSDFGIWKSDSIKAA